MKKILFLGGPFSQVAIVEKAQEMGLRVGVVDIDSEAPARAVADDFFCESILNRGAIFKIVEEYKPDALTCGACDTPVRVAAEVCEHFNLPGNSIATAIKSTNKLSMLEAFSQAGVPHPKYQYLSRESIYETLPQLPYPLISKPVDCSGSHGINLITCEEEYTKKIEESSRAGRSGDILLEEYLVGEEVSVEVIVVDSIPHVLQVTDKITTGAPHFCEIGHSQPSTVSCELRKQVTQVAVDACRAVGLVNSPAHVEMKLTKSGPVMIELGARMAGDTISTHLINQSVRGISMAEQAIRIALGEKIELPVYEDSGKFVAIRFIGLKEGQLLSVCGEEDAKKVPGVEFVSLFCKIGKQYSKSNSNADRVGYVIATGRTKMEALTCCQAAIDRLSVDWKNF